MNEIVERVARAIYAVPTSRRPSPPAQNASIWLLLQLP